jgi:hypothetical protein
MKIITLTLLTMVFSVGVVQAKVYKCPGKIEGQYTYQEKPCKGAKADEHTVKIVPSDEKKIAEAQAKLANEISSANSQPIVEPPTEPNNMQKTTQPVVENSNNPEYKTKPTQPAAPQSTAAKPAPPAPAPGSPPPPKPANY